MDKMDSVIGSVVKIGPVGRKSTQLPAAILCNHTPLQNCYLGTKCSHVHGDP